ncbi:MAG: hypothetical protein ACI4V1_02285 [Eubacteriales bacterium]
MRHYRRSYSGSARVKKIMFRILFVILAAAVITFASILLGNYLQKKVADAEAVRHTSEPAQEQITSRPQRSESTASQRSLSASGLALRNCRTEDEAVAAVNTLAEHYDTILVDLYGAEGSLLYTSPALCSLLRLPAPENDETLTLVRAALTAAKSKNLYLCAVIETSFGQLEEGTDALVDGTLFAELASFGVDEILIVGAFPDAEEEEIPAEEIVSYLTTCAERTAGSCELGMLVPDDIFLDFSNARDIQTIASAADFMGIDMTSDEVVTPDEMYAKTSQNVTSLYGSFSIYNMRVLLSTADADLLAAQYQALMDSDITNICFTEPILPSSLNYSSERLPVEPEEEPAETVSSAHAEPESNPYAVGIAEEEKEKEEEPLPVDETPEDNETAPLVDDSWYIDENGGAVRPWY